MKIISQAHVDSHTALLVKAKESLKVHAVWLQRAEAALLRTDLAIAAFKAKPWYKRFTWAEMTNDHDRWLVGAEKQSIEFLAKVFERAQYELTIELDDRESDILFRKYPTN